MTYQPKMIEASPAVWQAVMGADVDECKWEAAMLCLESHQPVTFQHNQCEYTIRPDDIYKAFTTFQPADHRELVRTIRTLVKCPEAESLTEWIQAERARITGEHDHLIDLLAQAERERDAAIRDWGPDPVDPVGTVLTKTGNHPTLDGYAFTGRECTPYHWQVRRTAADGTVATIWNIYPTKLRVCVDPKHPGPHFDIDDIKPLTLDNCAQAAVSACL
jgi:hypothetical protein